MHEERTMMADVDEFREVHEPRGIRRISGYTAGVLGREERRRRAAATNDQQQRHELHEVKAFESHHAY